MTTKDLTLDNGTRLAIERTRLAYERTLMAWIRTAASLISFGFTIYKFFEFESGKNAAAASTNHLLSPRQFAMVMIATGVLALTFATIDHYRNISQMNVQYGKGERSTSLLVAALVSCMGLAALLVVWFRG